MTQVERSDRVCECGLPISRSAGQGRRAWRHGDGEILCPGGEAVATPVAVRHGLRDGSVVVVEPIGHQSSLISRFVGGECVWGQAFSSSEHAEQVEGVLAAMRTAPECFTRHDLWDSQGRAVTA